MFAEFKHTLRRKRGQIIGWGIGLFLYGFLMSGFFADIKEMGDQMQQLLESYPPELLAFLPSITEFATPVGYLDTELFSFMPLIIGIFSIGAGAGLLVSDEEKGILDLVLAHPVSRTSLFWGRVLGYPRHNDHYSVGWMERMVDPRGKRWIGSERGRVPPTVHVFIRESTSVWLSRIGTKHDFAFCSHGRWICWCVIGRKFSADWNFEHQYRFGTSL